MDNRKRIREPTDVAIALADDRTLCSTERALLIKTRERAVRALLKLRNRLASPVKAGRVCRRFRCVDALGQRGRGKGRANGSILDPQRECPYPALSVDA
jgi:hypothetical protein